MKSEHDESKKLLLGLLIGGVVGVGALYCIKAAQSNKTPVLKKIGKTICNVGEMIENCDLDAHCDMVQAIEKKLPTGVDIVSSLSDWVNAGMSLWKHLKKG